MSRVYWIFPPRIIRASANYRVLLSEVNFPNINGLGSRQLMRSLDCLYSCAVATELASATVADSNEDPWVTSRPTSQEALTSRHNFVTIALASYLRRSISTRVIQDLRLKLKRPYSGCLGRNGTTNRPDLVFSGVTSLWTHEPSKTFLGTDDHAIHLVIQSHTCQY